MDNISRIKDLVDIVGRTLRLRLDEGLELQQWLSAQNGWVSASRALEQGRQIRHKRQPPSPIPENGGNDG